ncbi:MAG: hypothetical protein GMKNLPBB_01613 [Myxococcota bacterium]|nr:hypothetical protein [Myxococcota bacterium]
MRFSILLIPGIALALASCFPSTELGSGSIACETDNECAPGFRCFTRRCISNDQLPPDGPATAADASVPSTATDASLPDGPLPPDGGSEDVRGDASSGDAADAAPSDSASPENSGPGDTDSNCGGPCTLPNSFSECSEGRCVIIECKSGFFDIDFNPSNGCEYACAGTIGVAEVCDTADNNCNGLTDEGFNLNADSQNCGKCGRQCPGGANASPVCRSGNCGLACEPGFSDANQDPKDGCESKTCIPTNNGVEICDLVDNNCDGAVDEGIAKNLAGSCGPQCLKCEFANASALCVNGKCQMGDCQPGFADLNKSPQDGCESACGVTGAPEVCDGRDNNCNGRVDEGFDLSRDINNCGKCGTTCPAVSHGTPVCQGGKCGVVCDNFWKPNAAGTACLCESSQACGDASFLCHPDGLCRKKDFSTQCLNDSDCPSEYSRCDPDHRFCYSTAGSCSGNGSGAGVNCRPKSSCDWGGPVISGSKKCKCGGVQDCSPGLNCTAGLCRP